MATKNNLKRYEEICTRHQSIGSREFNKNDVVRVVSLSDRDADIMNGTESEHGFKYVLVEEKAKEPTDKEIRKELFAKAEELGLSPAKNIKTDELKKLIEEAK
jgi:hypothetical protein